VRVTLQERSARLAAHSVVPCEASHRASPSEMCIDPPRPIELTDAGITRTVIDRATSSLYRVPARGAAKGKGKFTLIAAVKGANRQRPRQDRLGVNLKD
jgi:hypothetical protein